MKSIFLAVCLFSAAIIARAQQAPLPPAERPEPPVVAPQPPASPEFSAGHMQFDPNKMIDRMAQRDPTKADELRKLKAEDPCKFQEEMQKLWRERMGRRDGQGSDDKGGLGRMHGRMDVRESLEAKHNEYIKFLEQNYPEEAAELAMVKEKTPDQYFGRLRTSLEKYGRIAKAAKDNPELAAVLKQDVVLKSQTEEVVKQLRAVSDETKKKELTDKLRGLVNERFDLIVKQKELRYQDMNKRLAELQKQVNNQQAELQKLKTKKEQQVNERVSELLSESEKIDWE